MSKPTSETSLGPGRMTRQCKYRSRMDGVWVVLLLSCATAFLAGGSHATADSMLGRGLIEVATTIATIFILVGVPCHYTLHEQELRVQSGLFILGIPYAEILSASPERTARWAPAWSRDRLVLHCTKGDIRVSPVRQAQFLAELERRLQEFPPTDLREPLPSLFR